MDRRAILERQRTIHVSFGGIEFGIEGQLEIELGVVQTDSDVRSGQPVAEYVGFAVGVANSQCALTYEASEEVGQKTHLIVLHGSPCAGAARTTRRERVRIAIEFDGQRIILQYAGGQRCSAL